MAKEKPPKKKGKDDADGKAKGDAKRKGDSKRKGEDDGGPGASIATHPQASASIRRVKGWAGLGGFAVAAIVSLSAAVPMFQVGLRALGAGVVAYLLAWWISVHVWRQLIIAEQRAAAEQLRRRFADAQAEQSNQASAPAAPAR